VKGEWPKNNVTYYVNGGGIWTAIQMEDVTAVNGIIHYIDRVLGVPYQVKAHTRGLMKIRKNLFGKGSACCKILCRKILLWHFYCVEFFPKKNIFIFMKSRVINFWPNPF
jgi:hypothetical protein